ncbi:MAG: TrkA family potassium uptake protein [Clostridia bacterium]
MKSMLVIGLGRFGKHLAQKCMELGNEVMVVDKDEACVRALCNEVTEAHVGDCKDEEVLRALGVSNFDVCFVCTSSDFQSSLEVTSLLKELGAKKVVSKADRDIHAKFLLRNGADEVVYPERDMASRAAVKYSNNRTFDYVELSPDYAIFEVKLPEGWAGKTVRELNVRKRFDVNVIAVKLDGKVIAMIDADHAFDPDEHLIIAGNRHSGMRLFERR